MGGQRLTAEQASQHPWIKHHTRHFFGESLLQSLVTGLLVFMVAVAFFYLYFYILSHYFNIENFLVSKLTDASSRAIHSLGVHLSEATDSIIGQLNTLRQSLTQTSFPSWPPRSRLSGEVMNEVMPRVRSLVMSLNVIKCVRLIRKLSQEIRLTNFSYITRIFFNTFVLNIIVFKPSSSY